MNTNLETKDNTPYQSDEELDEDIDYDTEAMSDDDDDEMIYHVDPKGVVRHNLELIGKVKQSFIFCRQCEKWKPLTTDNSVTLPYGTKMRLQYKRYIGGICLTRKCNYEQWQKELAKELTLEKELAKELTLEKELAKDLTLEKDLTTQNK